MTNFKDKNTQKAAELRIYFDLMRVDQIVQVRVNHPLVCLVQSYAHLVFFLTFYLVSGLKISFVSFINVPQMRK